MGLPRQCPLVHDAFQTRRLRAQCVAKKRAQNNSNSSSSNSMRRRANLAKVCESSEGMQHAKIQEYKNTEITEKGTQVHVFSLCRRLSPRDSSLRVGKPIRVCVIKASAGPQTISACVSARACVTRPPQAHECCTRIPAPAQDWRMP